MFIVYLSIEYLVFKGPVSSSLFSQPCTLSVITKQNGTLLNEYSIKSLFKTANIVMKISPIKSAYFYLLLAYFMTQYFAEYFNIYDSYINTLNLFLKILIYFTFVVSKIIFKMRQKQKVINTIV